MKEPSLASKEQRAAPHCTPAGLGIQLTSAHIHTHKSGSGEHAAA